ncbi:MAG: tRNA (adenosine(37)-N6)-threonylcarbamoyltransferase complex ATPase subunit type 1 TsaE [Proteobacteria bacterium]|nr:tRNA (adenosine(37)-N6)-threonylcarbamoyltransferase complex ATPase subunit type 1 TsaE [Pseudomonadota bacterium]
MVIGEWAGERKGHMEEKTELFISKSFEETILIGEEFSKKIYGGAIVALYGELGSGKTHFVKGIAKGLRVEREITSPSFVISQYYRGTLFNLIHIDLYRINNFNELEDIGWYDFLNEKNIILIEWADKIEEELREYKVIRVYFSYINENSREIKIIYPN